MRESDERFHLAHSEEMSALGLDISAPAPTGPIRCGGFMVSLLFPLTRTMILERPPASGRP